MHDPIDIGQYSVCATDREAQHYKPARHLYMRTIRSLFLSVHGNCWINESVLTFLPIQARSLRLTPVFRK